MGFPGIRDAFADRSPEAEAEVIHLTGQPIPLEVLQGLLSEVDAHGKC